jgi:hypothetical protein
LLVSKEAEKKLQEENGKYKKKAAMKLEQGIDIRK